MSTPQPGLTITAQALAQITRMHYLGIDTRTLAEILLVAGVKAHQRGSAVLDADDVMEVVKEAIFPKAS